MNREQYGEYAYCGVRVYRDNGNLILPHPHPTPTLSKKGEGGRVTYAL